MVAEEASEKAPDRRAHEESGGEANEQEGRQGDHLRVVDLVGGAGPRWA
jgi:hypothetical protein